MALTGELASLVVSLTQEIGIVAGVGALTITLVGHLLSLHAHKNETVFSYVRAARTIRALALIAIIISGGAAILIHFQSGTPEVLMAPAFLFKWALIALLTSFYFMELGAEGIKRDAVEGFEGANWYALFIVHTMAPVVAWTLMLEIYVGWLAAFGVIWALFVGLMRWQGKSKPPAAAAMAPKTAPPQAPVMPKPIAAPAPMPSPKPIPPPAPAPIPKIEIHPNHSMLPMVAELDLPAPAAAAVPPKPAPAPAAPAAAPVAPPVSAPQAPVEAVPQSSKPAAAMPDLEGPGLPALHVMPKRPEDIESSKRGPVVKMSDE